jgi:hypothetical protein
MTADPTAEIRADLSAFADDDEEVIVDRSGECLLVRGGEEITFKLVEDETRLLVEHQDTRLSYRDFVAHRLAKLDVLAERIVAKRLPVTPYIDGCGTLEAAGADPMAGGALELLDAECSRHVPFVSRVLFVTADAGQGKTALLRQFQHEQARHYMEGNATYLFWHVDLQGRQLLRLSEALMGDLADLRFSGLWMPGVIRLLRHRALVLAIDGFDELAAEQGGSDALGALAMLVQMMGDRGTIVAASRRTFFDTEDYVSRARLFSRTGGGDCQFDQLSLDAWGASEGRKYLSEVAIDGKGFGDADAIYEAIERELGGPDHPMLTRPFLLAQVARGLLRFDLAPADFIRGMNDPYQGVGAVIEAFVDREVSDKWKHAETGEPYLTREQHLRLLSDVAEEMFRSQRAILNVEVVETLATLLLDEWGIDQVRQQQVLDMVKMHVLLTPAEGDFHTRTFGHEEFLAWFTAYALKDRLLRLQREGAAVSHDLLSIAQLSDSTARYVCALIERTPDQVEEILGGLVALVRREWRPTYLQLNVGTLIPYLLDGVQAEQRLEVDADVVYASVVFEGSRLTGVTIRNGTFVNASFERVEWRDVRFERCEMGEPVFYRGAKYEDVVLEDCVIEGVHIVDGESGEESREYAPDRVTAALARRGVEIRTPAAQATLEGLAAALPEGETRKLVRRVLNVFRRTTFLSETTVQHRFSRDARRVIDEIMPLMEKHGIVKPKPWRGSGKQLAWGSDMSLEIVERADGDKAQPLYEFWAEVDELDRA